MKKVIFYFLIIQYSIKMENNLEEEERRRKHREASKNYMKKYREMKKAEKTSKQAEMKETKEETSTEKPFLDDLLNKKNITFEIQEKEEEEEPKYQRVYGEKKDEPPSFLESSSSTFDPEFIKRQYQENKKNEKEGKKKTSTTSKSLNNFFKTKKDDDDIFNPSEIVGKEKRVLLNKIKQYKNLFPTELKHIKINPKWGVSELRDTIEEFDVLLSTTNADQFITESILACLKVIEGASSYTKYNISGMSEMLKMNPQFNLLCRQLYLKYGVFERVPPEGQLIFMIMTTAYIARQKNSQKSSLEDYLNQPIPIPPNLDEKK